MDESDLWGEDPAMERWKQEKQDRQPSEEKSEPPKVESTTEQKICQNCGHPLLTIGKCQAVCFYCGRSETACDAGGDMR